MARLASSGGRAMPSEHATQPGCARASRRSIRRSARRKRWSFAGATWQGDEATGERGPGLETPAARCCGAIGTGGWLQKRVSSKKLLTRGAAHPGGGRHASRTAWAAARGSRTGPGPSGVRGEGLAGMTEHGGGWTSARGGGHTGTACGTCATIVHSTCTSGKPVLGRERGGAPGRGCGNRQAVGSLSAEVLRVLDLGNSGCAMPWCTRPGMPCETVGLAWNGSEGSSSVWMQNSICGWACCRSRHEIELISHARWA